MTLLAMTWRLLGLRGWTSRLLLLLLLLLWGPLLLLLLLRGLLLWRLPWSRGLWVARLALRALLTLGTWTLLLLRLLLGRDVGWLSRLRLWGLAIGRLTWSRAVGTLGLLVGGS